MVSVDVFVCAETVDRGASPAEPPPDAIVTLCSGSALPETTGEVETPPVSFDVVEVLLPLLLELLLDVLELEEPAL